jgi:hypothetical protein
VRDLIGEPRGCYLVINAEIIAMSTQSDYYTALYCQDFPKRRKRDTE